MSQRRWERNHDRERVASLRDLLLFLAEGIEYIIVRQDEMEAKMSEFDTTLAAEGDAIASLGTSLTATLGDLQAEVANLEANPSIPAGSLDALKAHVASLQGLTAQVTAADPGQAPAPAPAPVDTPAPAPVDAPVDTPAPAGTEVSPGVVVGTPDPTVSTDPNA